MRSSAALALCALLALGVQADTDSGGSPEFVRRYALDTVRHYEDRGHARNTTDMFTGLKYFTTIPATLPFWALLPRLDHAQGYNVLLWKEGVLDALEDKLARSIFSRLCPQGSPLMVDVGANIGRALPLDAPPQQVAPGRLSAAGAHAERPGRWYSLLALAHGCRVVAIEAGADHLANLNMSLALNGWLDRARLYHAVASGDREVTFNGWNAVSGEQPQGYSGHHDGRGKSFASQTPVALDDVVDEEVAYLKVDVESHEPSVFRSARRLVEGRRVKYVLFEWTYFLGGKYHFSAYAEDVLGPLFAARYRCFLAEAGDLRAEISADTLPLAVKRLHAYCMRLNAGAQQRWCIINVICMRDDQEAPLDAPLITEA